MEEAFLLEAAWGIIANAGVPQGDWDSTSPEWHEAAVRWRDRYHDWLATQVEAVEEAVE